MLWAKMLRPPRQVLISDTPITLIGFLYKSKLVTCSIHLYLSPWEIHNKWWSLHHSVSQLKENWKLTIFQKNVISMWVHDTDFMRIHICPDHVYRKSYIILSIYLGVGPGMDFRPMDIKTFHWKRMVAEM